MVTRESIIEVLKTIEDPELFLDIWFMGLIYNITLQEAAEQKSNVDIEMTFTTPMCPAGPQLVSEVEGKLRRLEGVAAVNVKVTFSPPWEPSEEVKGMLGMI